MTNLNADNIGDANRIVRMQAVGAYENALAEGRHYAAIRNALLGSPGPGRHLGDIVTLVSASEPGDITQDVYAVEVKDRTTGDAWTTLVYGKTDHMHFAGPTARYTAILHAIALVHSSGTDSHAAAAFYAGRVLGLPEDGE